MPLSSAQTGHQHRHPVRRLAWLDSWGQERMARTHQRRSPGSHSKRNTRCHTHTPPSLPPSPHTGRRMVPCPTNLRALDASHMCAWRSQPGARTQRVHPQGMQTNTPRGASCVSPVDTAVQPAGHSAAAHANKATCVANATNGGGGCNGVHMPVAQTKRAIDR